MFGFTLNCLSSFNTTPQKKVSQKLGSLDLYLENWEWIAFKGIKVGLCSFLIYCASKIIKPTIFIEISFREMSAHQSNQLRSINPKS